MRRAPSHVVEEMSAKQEQCVEESSIPHCEGDESNAQRLRSLLYVVEEVRAMRDGIAPSYVVKEVRAMRDGAKLSKKDYSLLVRHSHSHLP